MIGKIKGIEENLIILELTDEALNGGELSNMYVSIESPNNICIGEIEEIKERIAYIHLLGELINGRFVFGVIKKPSVNANVRLVPTDKIPMIISTDNTDESKYLHLGTSPVFENVSVDIPINPFFSNHFAILGNSGAGKSCTVASIFQKLYLSSPTPPVNSSLFFFDAYGEYTNAFGKLNQHNSQLDYKVYTTNYTDPNTELLRIPLWLLDVDDIALLLNANDASQLPIIEKALKLVPILKGTDELSILNTNLLLYIILNKKEISQELLI